MKGLISKILCGFLITLIGVVSISAFASTPAEKKYIDLEAEFKSGATLKKGRVGVDSYGGRRTTLKCLRLTREFLFKVVKDSSYPPIAVVEKVRLFNYVEATCTNIVMSIDLIKKNSNLERAVDASLSCMVFKGMDWKLKNLGTEKV